MKWDHLWDEAIYFIMKLGMPALCAYFSICSNVFLNTAAEDARGLEKLSNYALVPFQYLFAGKSAYKDGEGFYRLTQRFEYQDQFYLKTATAIVFLPLSLVVGSTCKAIALLSSETRDRYHAIVNCKESTYVRSNRDLYSSFGIDVGCIKEAPFIDTPLHKREQGAEEILKIEKEGLREIINILTENDIPYWMDCGSCLGAYRYGGVIPWDYDIDISVLRPDFDNVMHALNRLDKEKYIVQDWSGRENPNSYIRVYVKNSLKCESIDIYHFDIHPEKKEVLYLFSMENNVFMFEWWRIRERRFKVPVQYSMLFPLKRALFDGIEVAVPNQTKEYLQRVYGENIGPAKIYNEQTCSYEKDLSHPYWQRSYAH